MHFTNTSKNKSMRLADGLGKEAGTTKKLEATFF